MQADGSDADTTAEMRSRTLLTQVLAVNAVLVAVTAALAAIFTTASASRTRRRVPGVSLLGRRRARGDPAQLAAAAPPARAAGRASCSTMERGRPRQARHARASPTRTPPRRSSASPPASTAMLERLEEERRAAGRAVVRAQEQERARIAQDLHDEVNQALTAIKLRLSATMHDAPAQPASRAARDQAARRPRDGRAAAHRPRAAPDRARRPRPDPRAAVAGRRLRRAHRHPDRPSTATASCPTSPTRSSS